MNRNISSRPSAFLCKKKLMKKFILIPALFVYAIILNACTVKNIENWKTQVEGAIFATPVTQNGIIFIGTESGNFYWIDGKSGNVVHEAKLSSPIRSNALLFDGKVYFESLGGLHCFDAFNATEIFRFTPEDEKIDMVDPWDYYHSSPVTHDGLIYYAANKGKVYAVNPKNGNLVKTIITPEGAAIRSALTFDSNNLYFGDNNGIVYEYNLLSEAFTMAYKTFTQRPYSTYGFITGGPLINNGKLIFSNRHETFTALDLKTKSIAWSKTDEYGSWWPAGPVISEGKVIIGGSDNLILSVLTLNSGKVCWEYKTDYNIFCTPLILDNTIIFGTGDSYLNRKGNGSVFSLNLNDGKLINKYKPTGNIFSSPIELDENIIVCTTTGIISSIRKNIFTAPQPSKIEIEGDADITFQDGGSSIAEKQLLINNLSEKAVAVNYSLKNNKNLPDTLIRLVGEKDKVYSSGRHNLYLQANRANLKQGVYSGTIIFTAKNGEIEEKISKPFSINITGNAKQEEPSFEISDIIADPKDCSVKLKLQVNSKTLITGNLLLSENDSIAGYIIQTKPKWGIFRLEKEIFSVDFNQLKVGKYRMVFESKEQKLSYDFVRE